MVESLLSVESVSDRPANSLIKGHRYELMMTKTPMLFLSSLLLSCVPLLAFSRLPFSFRLPLLPLSSVSCCFISSPSHSHFYTIRLLSFFSHFFLPILSICFRTSVASSSFHFIPLFHFLIQHFPSSVLSFVFFPGILCLFLFVSSSLPFHLTSFTSLFPFLSFPFFTFLSTSPHLSTSLPCHSFPSIVSHHRAVFLIVSLPVTLLLVSPLLFLPLLSLS